LNNGRVYGVRIVKVREVVAVSEILILTRIAAVKNLKVKNKSSVK
jgi:hypothetical protein